MTTSQFEVLESSDLILKALSKEEINYESNNMLFYDCYEYLEIIGRGGFGIVISAIDKLDSNDKKIRKKCAIKVISIDII